MLAADFSNLRGQLAAVEGKVEMLHLDVMDGHFVPNLTFGMPVIASIRPHSTAVFDCHLMTTNPDRFIDELAEVGADIVTMHLEAMPDPAPAAARVRAEGMRFGVVISPNTPFGAMEPFIEASDMVLIMSVHPGFGGQSFIPEVLGKVEAARKFVDSHGFTTDVQIDGGIGPDTVVSARDAGANVFVAGSAVFGTDDPGAAIEELRRLIEA